MAIFEVEKLSLFSVQYEGETAHEFQRLFDNWGDTAFLFEFFKEQEGDLQTDFNSNISIQEAIQKVQNEADYLNDMLMLLAKQGKTDKQYSLDTLFTKLNNNDVNETRSLQESKTKNRIKKSWLRIYAIRIGPNQYVISGGAIKLVFKMDEKEYLKQEINKLNLTKEYLKNLGVLDETDLDLLEISI